MTKRKWKHRGLRTSWWIVRLARKVADWMDDLHFYLQRAMFDICSDCGAEDGYGHRNECQFRRNTIAKGRVVKVSKRPPLILPEDDNPLEQEE